MEIKNQIKTSGVITIVIGFWLLIAPTFFGYTNSAARVSDIWMGLLIGIISFLKIVKPNLQVLSWITITFGIWLIFSPIIIAYSNTIFFWNDIFTGLVVLTISLWDITALQTNLKFAHKNPHRLSI